MAMIAMWSADAITSSDFRSTAVTGAGGFLAVLNILVFTNEQI